MPSEEMKSRLRARGCGGCISGSNRFASPRCHLTCATASTHFSSRPLARALGWAFGPNLCARSGFSAGLRYLYYLLTLASISLIARATTVSSRFSVSSIGIDT